jgi:hypothetical protein
MRRNVFLGEWELPPGTPVLARLPYISVSLHSGETKSKSRGWFARKRPLADASMTALLLAAAAASGVYSLLHRLGGR